MGSLFKPFGPLTDDVAAASFTQQATDLPIACRMSFDTHQRTMMGVAPADFAAF